MAINAVLICGLIIRDLEYNHHETIYDKAVSSRWFQNPKILDVFLNSLNFIVGVIILVLPSRVI